MCNASDSVSARVVTDRAIVDVSQGINHTRDKVEDERTRHKLIPLVEMVDEVVEISQLCKRCDNVGGDSLSGMAIKRCSNLNDVRMWLDLLQNSSLMR